MIVLSPLVIAPCSSKFSKMAISRAVAGAWSVRCYRRRGRESDPLLFQPMISLKTLRAAGREIRKAHPEVLGVGLGVRRSQGRVRHSDLVFKIYVENKFGERKP